MKKSFISLSLLAALAFSGCSNDELADNNGKGGNGDGKPNYIAVSLVTPKEFGGPAGSPASRALDFENGVGNESAAKEALFLFFDAQGNPTQTPQRVALNLPDDPSTSTTPPQVEKVSEKVLVVAGNTEPTQLLVVLNTAADKDGEFANKRLSEVAGIVGDYKATYNEAGELQPLVLTNSAYKEENGTAVLATDISSHISQNQAMALANPAQVYVERVVAKVATAEKEGGMTITPTPTDAAAEGAVIINKEVVKLVPVIEGVEVANVSTTSYLFKNIANSNSWGEWAWDADNKRSYWANCPTDLAYANKSWNAIKSERSTQKLDENFYVQENTTSRKTAVIVTATLKKDGESEGYTFLRWNGNYYAKDKFLEQYATILKNKNFRLRTGLDSNPVYTTIGVDRLDWLPESIHKELVESTDPDKQFRGYETTAYLSHLKIKDGEKLVIWDGTNETAVPVDDVNNVLREKDKRAWIWEGGKCYYFVDIDHLSNAAEGYKQGVVRNHVYRLTLNSLKGIGTPVFYPDETIIPEKPSDKLFYLGAQINILRWRVVTQTVDFE